jgi:hypothetical protein
MHKYVKAFAMALSNLAGPFGAAIEFYFSLYEDARAQERDDKIYAMISENRNLSNRALEEIFEVKTAREALREQSLIGMKTCIEITQENRELLSNLQNLERKVSTIIEREQARLEENGFITNEIITQELSSLYADQPDLFLTSIGAAGFPLNQIPQGNAPKVIVFKFLSRCQGLDNDKKLKIFKALYKENRGSKTLSVVVRLLEEKYN